MPRRNSTGVNMTSATLYAPPARYCVLLNCCSASSKRPTRTFSLVETAAASPLAASAAFKDSILLLYTSRSSGCSLARASAYLILYVCSLPSSLAAPVHSSTSRDLDHGRRLCI
eukprot:GHUV01007855.1.p1 GENE.GHUV01007855.1~~GHUV01007855.1.p1  ORF type:complete len:114 (-),score=11.02 GHUV01007855.1:1148-1489(-)